MSVHILFFTQKAAYSSGVYPRIGLPELEAWWLPRTICVSSTGIRQNTQYECLVCNRKRIRHQSDLCWFANDQATIILLLLPLLYTVELLLQWYYYYNTTAACMYVERHSILIIVVNVDISSPTRRKQLRLGSSACVPMISDAQSNGVTVKVCVSRFAHRSAYWLLCYLYICAAGQVKESKLTAAW